MTEPHEAMLVDAGTPKRAPGAATAASRRRLDTCVAVAVALAVACWAAFAFGTPILGHDEGIYVLTAASIRESGEYRLTNLPSRPLQTKYPPLYPLVLAGVLAPDVPVADQVIRLKVVNAVCLAVTVVLTAVLLRRIGVSGPWPLASALLLLALSPGMLASTNWLMAEQLFTTLLVAVVVAAPQSVTDRSAWRLAAAALLAGLATLTRSVGIAVCIGLLWYLGRTLGRTRAVVAGLIMLALVGPWWIWASLDESTPVSPLERYYVTYERSAWARFVETPGFASLMLVSNARGLASAVPLVAGFYTVTTAVIGATLTCVGLVRARRLQLTRLIVAISVVYILIAAGHPMNLDRYVVPLLPPAVLLLSAGFTALTTGTSIRARTWNVPVHLAMALLVAANVLWARHYTVVARMGKNAGIGYVQPFDWKGFEEVSAWLRANSAPTAIIASGYDTTYAAYTGRRGLRPWLHEPEAYDPSYGRYLRWSTDVDTTARLLTQADVSYLIVDPYLPDGPGMHARTMVHALMRRYPGRWELCFTSSDGRHQIYRRADPDVE
jgi:hypothetical protein